MFRKILIMCTIGILLLSSCGGTANGDSDSEDNGDQQTDSSQAGAGQPGSAGSPGGSAGQPETGEAVSMRAQELLRTGNVEAAITILEEYSADQPPFPGINELLIEAHMQYTDWMLQSRAGEPETVFSVFYYHFMRVLELDPENEEALEGLGRVHDWYETRGLALPETIDPLAFLTPGDIDEADSSDDSEQTEDESEDDSENAKSPAEESDPE